MKNLILILIMLTGCQGKNQDVTPWTDALQNETPQARVKALALQNGFETSDAVADAIVKASKAFDVDALHLTAIGIIESGLGKNAVTRKNKNGTHDKGVFQINTVNWPKCKEFRIETLQGNAFCAAKLLSQIEMRKPSDIGKYHSKTPSKKIAYFAKLTKVLKTNADK
jgi:hypothetical protein